MELIYSGNSLVYKRGDEAIKYVVYPDDVETLSTEAEISHKASQVVLTPEIYTFVRYYKPKLMMHNGKEYEVYSKIVSQYVEGMTLEEYMKEDLSMSDRLSLCEAVINIVETLHSNGITHNDLWAFNFLVDAEGQLWLIDWGAANMGSDRWFDVNTVRGLVAGIYYGLDQDAIADVSTDLGRFTNDHSLKELRETLRG